MKPSWLSFESTSSEIPFVSGNSSVEPTPVSMNTARTPNLYQAGINFNHEETMKLVYNVQNSQATLRNPENHNLGDDGANLSCGSRNAVCRGAVARREDFTYTKYELKLLYFLFIRDWTPPGRMNVVVLGPKF
jgi:hypothetical protein